MDDRKYNVSALYEHCACVAKSASPRRERPPLPVLAQRAVAALPHDAHFMGIVLTALNALSTVHPEQNPALAGQNIYQSKEIQDKQIVRLIGARALDSVVPCSRAQAPRGVKHVF